MDPLVLFMFYFYLFNAVVHVLCSLVIICWNRAGLYYVLCFLTPLCVGFSCGFVTFQYGVWGQV